MYPDSAKNLNYETKDAVYWFVTSFQPLDNWSAHTVNIWGKKFLTTEHAYHYSKYAETAPAIARKIFDAPSPWAAMKIDRQHAGKRRKDWDKVKISIMTEIVSAKVVQNEDVRQCLLGTGNKQLFENSPWDKFWGCGEDKTGQNHMGKILMQIRDQLIDKSPSSG
ncbi:MAG TPA: NADAR family protein [Candidatus Saccharimonadales bacterium]|nr:NADAR family protein [Candidatus Saccharimonadales bacterium]